MKSFQDPDNLQKWVKRLVSLLVAFAVLLEFVFLGAQIFWSARDAQSFWQQEQLKRERAVERIKTMQADFQVIRATREP